MLENVLYTHIDSVLVDLDDVVVDVHVDHVHGVVVLVHGVRARVAVVVLVHRVAAVVVGGGLGRVLVHVVGAVVVVRGRVHDLDVAVGVGGAEVDGRRRLVVAVVRRRGRLLLRGCVVLVGRRDGRLGLRVGGGLLLGLRGLLGGCRRLRRGLVRGRRVVGRLGLLDRCGRFGLRRRGLLDGCGF